MSSSVSCSISDKPVLKLRHVELTLASKAGPVEILKRVDLDIQGGESIGLVGPSGSGKSSLLMLLGGLERATGGLVEAMGLDLTRLNENELAIFRQDNMGIIFQSFHLIPTMTAVENVATPLELAGQTDAFDRAEASLQRVGLQSRLHHYPAQLSGGEQQRVALARAVAPKPKILLADEPTGNLDRTTGGEIADLLFQLTAQAGATMVLVSHDPGLAARCDRVLKMHDGRLQSPTASTERVA